MRLIDLARAALLVLLTNGLVQAHHGYADFFDLKERTVLVEGTLEHLLFANPHVVMKIRTADATVYELTWQSPNTINRSDVTVSTLALGDVLTVVGAPPRDPLSHEILRLCEVKRARDGWTWRTAQPFAPPAR